MTTTPDLIERAKIFLTSWEHCYTPDGEKKRSAMLLEEFITALESRQAPTDSGVKELDFLCERFNKGEISLCALISRAWNTAIAEGDNQESRQDAGVDAIVADIKMNMILPKRSEKTLREILAKHLDGIPRITKDRGKWHVGNDGKQTFLESDDFTHDVRLYLNGDFGSKEDRQEYCDEVCAVLNAACGHGKSNKAMLDALPQPEVT